MIRHIAITFGSEDILRPIIDKYPDRELQLYKLSSTEAKELMLLDYSGMEPIFESPVTYDALAHAGNDNWTGFVNFATLNLNEDQQKVFDARVNKLMSDILPTGMNSIYSLNYHNDINQRILLTTWESYSNYEIWHKDSLDLTPKGYQSSPSSYHHEASYIPA